jgi:hypothetical protein
LILIVKLALGELGSPAINAANLSEFVKLIANNVYKNIDG